jgi:hypothetical protein
MLIFLVTASSIPALFEMDWLGSKSIIVVYRLFANPARPLETISPAL